MNTNPYAPPHSAFGDAAREEEILHVCARITFVVAINAALVGTLILVSAVVAMVRNDAQGSLLAAHVLVALYGALAIVAAMGLYRQRRWAAIVWLVQSGLILLAGLSVARYVRAAEFVVVGILITQVIASLAGLWAVLRRRAIKSGVAPRQVAN